ncbi:SatD family protein [Microbacter sp. GSS18]|nr:SatD family protein [Microbacter sp. GSS18]
MTVAVIADIVGSRRLADRAGAQAEIDAAIERVETDRPGAVERLRATAGDEFQGVYPDLASALGATLLLQLALPDGIELRFGLGLGPIQTISSAAGAIPEGPGWWVARDAIETVEAKQRRAAPSARTWIRRSDEEDAGMQPTIDMANAYVLVRDELVGAMSERARRLTYGRCLGRTQSDLAHDEGITQPAVSQTLAGAGASAVVEGFLALEAGVTV